MTTEPEVPHTHEFERLTERERRTMAPWFALLATGLASAATLVAFEWFQRPMDSYVRWLLIGIAVVPLFAVSGGEVRDIGEWARERFGRK